MPASDGFRPRTFIKAGRGSEPVERLVSTPAEEVDALFDGFAEPAPPAPRKATGAGATAAKAD
ncbi:hypothetical protein [Actinoplanes derwentensis]|uniref:Uncharacterized protein n=1 Tax=Actinoplanes derwentensis TaxID=113562 RepID=A0A1H2CV80_9ACTN|nr:hypothetical protein [Actinoplanes derwentensis]GID82020.1 hypothetical protein Ade03nite_09440 [Actinoplanes derwentensis]SDT74383.1 hypothetical protein SAMN04489716_6965 [Actinoplanes derwentensis]